MGLRLVAIDNANEKGRGALLNIRRARRAHRSRSPPTEDGLSDAIAIFARWCVDECSGLDDGLRVRMVGGVNEIVDTLGVNEGLEGEG